MTHIIPIKDLKNTSEISNMCHRSDEPIYITKNGYADMVIMSIENFENITKQLNMYQNIDISEQQIRAITTKDAHVSLESLRGKYNV